MRKIKQNEGIVSAWGQGKRAVFWIQWSEKASLTLLWAERNQKVSLKEKQSTDPEERGGLACLRKYTEAKMVRIDCVNRRLTEDEVTEKARGQITKGLVGPGKNFEFYSKCDEEYDVF